MVEELMAARIASIIDENIDSTQALNQRGRHIFDLLRVCHIAGNRQAATTCGLNFSYEFIEFRAGTGGHCDIRASTSERQCNTASDAAPRTCHDSAFACKNESLIACHKVFP